MTLEFTFQELNLILDHLASPEQLNNHPWTQCEAVKAMVENDPGIQQKSPGYQLAITLCQTFRKMMPSTLPKHGKRLDTNWCTFGLLAAQYFAPFEFNSIYPISLRDAAGKIDEAIYLFALSKPVSELTAAEIESYKIIGDEAESLPVSTLSDWHIKGLHRLLESFCTYENCLKRNGVQMNPYLPKRGQESLGGLQEQNIPVTNKVFFGGIRQRIDFSKTWLGKHWPKFVWASSFLLLFCWE